MSSAVHVVVRLDGVERTFVELCVGDGGRWELPKGSGRDVESVVVVALPDFGRGQTVYTVHEGGDVEVGVVTLKKRWDELLAEWACGKAVLCPVTHWVLEKLSKGSRDWSCADPLLELRYAVDTLVCPIRSQTQPPFIHTNVVVHIGGVEAVLLDPGSSDIETLQRLLNYLLRHHRVEHLYCFITHIHRDHWAALHHVEQAFKGRSTLCGSTFTLEVIPSDVFSGTRRIFSMEEPSSKLIVGTRELTVVPIPGHTAGDLGLFFNGTLLSAGDHCVGWGSSLLDANCGDMTHYLQTCEKIRRMNPPILVPAHGPICYTSKTLMETYIKHRLDREKQVIACLDQGLRTPQQMVEVIYKETPRVLWPSAMSNIALHLRKIQQDRGIVNGNL